MFYWINQVYYKRNRNEIDNFCLIPQTIELERLQNHIFDFGGHFVFRVFAVEVHFVGFDVLHLSHAHGARENQSFLCGFLLVDAALFRVVLFFKIFLLWLDFLMSASHYRWIGGAANND